MQEVSLPPQYFFTISLLLFSVAGIIVNERAALDPHNKIIFLHDNSEPIHLHYQRLKKKCKCDACLASESESD